MGLKYVNNGIVNIKWDNLNKICTKGTILHVYYLLLWLKLNEARNANTVNAKKQ